LKKRGRNSNALRHDLGKLDTGPRDADRRLDVPQIVAKLAGELLGLDDLSSNLGALVE
jgi:hypothetical protein